MGSCLGLYCAQEHGPGGLGLGHKYVGHNYISHNYIGHNYTGHNYRAAPIERPVSLEADGTNTSLYGQFYVCRSYDWVRTWGRIVHRVLGLEVWGEAISMQVITRWAITI